MEQEDVKALVPPPRRDGARNYDKRFVVARFTEAGSLTYDTLTPDGLVLVEEFARKGHSVKSLCRVLGIHYATFRELRRRVTEVADAWDHGRASLDDEVNDVLLRHMREGNLSAAIFYAKGRLGWREVGPADGEAAAAPTVNINISAPLSDEQFAKMVQVNTPEADPA